MSRTIPIVFCMFAALVVGVLIGCGTRTMPTPLVFRAGASSDARVVLADVGRDLDLSAIEATGDVLYATDRRPKTRGDEVRGYGSARGITMRFGLATVRLGRSGSTVDDVTQSIAENERLRLSIERMNEFGEYWRTIPSSDDRYPGRGVEPLAEDPIRDAERRFIEEIDSRLSGARRVLIYVPGFNTSFETPVYYAAEFAFYLHGNAVPIAFSWPARSTPLGYPKQVTNATVSVRALRELVLLIANESNAERIDILSYSAGAPIVSDALHQLRLIHADLNRDELSKKLRIGVVIFAGADEDLDRFRNLYLDGFEDVAERVTLYSSRRDIGLTLSQLFVRGSPRLGKVAGELTPNEQVLVSDFGSNTDIIDVGYAQRRAGGGDIFSHGYWFGNPWVSSDVIAQLRFQRPPPPHERGLQAVSDSGDVESPVWRFPDDYPQRIDRVFKEASLVPATVPDAPRR
jgi:esterase/lipase superfamily enzyme